jgi:MFS family permease
VCAVPSRIRDRNIWLIYGATALLTIAYGVAVAVLAVFLKGRGYTKPDIGELATIFAAGIVLFALPMGKVIKRLSARRTLTISLLGYAVVITLFPYVAHDFWLTAGVRFIDGACSVGIWVSSEVILLSRAKGGQKAFVTSLYAISVGVGYLVGPFLAPALMLIMPIDFTFVVSGVLATLGGLLVWWRLDPDVTHHGEDGEESALETSAKQILWKIKTSCFGTFAYGYFQSAIVLFMPLYLIEVKGIEEKATVALFGFFALGMLSFANPAGRLGDKFGHLLLMRVLGILGCGVVASFIYVDAYWIMAISVTLAGATLASISPISLALQGVIVEPPDYNRSNAIYNVFYAAGMLVGPLISSRIFEAAGGIAMMVHLALLWALFVAFATVFANDDPARQVLKAKAARSA